MSTFPVLLNASPVRPSRKSTVSWLPALLGVAFVAFTSTAFMGGTHSQAVIAAIWQEVLGKWHFQDVGMANIVARKTGHFIGHGMLSLVFRNTWYTALRSRAQQGRRSALPGAALLAVFTTMAIASLDELHQMYVPGRVGSARDVLIDTTGALVANAIFLWMSTRQRRESTFSRRGGSVLAANF